DLRGGGGGGEDSPKRSRLRGGRGMSAWRTVQRVAVVGKARRRVDARAKVTGQTRFADDLSLPRMVHCKLLRSPHPHARILRIDLRAAREIPGVKLILTGRDMPVAYGILPVSQDEHALCLDRVRFVGDPVAAVVAVDEQTASEALDAIRVDYEPPPPFAPPGG